MSFNGGHQVNGGPGYTDLLKPPTAPQHKHSTTADIRLESEERKLDEFPQLATPPPSFSTPTSARTKSMERRKSAGLPTHLQLQGKGYGFPASTTQRFRSNTIEPGTRVPWITKAEVLSSIMVPLPYVLASYSTGHPVYQNTTKDAQGVYETSDGPVFASPTIWAVTSMTLMLMGCWGIFGTVNTNETTSQVEGEGQISGQVGTRSKLVRGVVRRLLTVGLPFYATSNLGAARVALIMLIGLASNIIAIEDEATDLTRIKTWRLLFTHRRWTMCSIILQLVCDLSGLTSSSSTSAIAFGYLALGLSALLLSPPYPSSRPKVSVDSTAETSFRTPEHKVASPQTSSVSPLVLSPKESQLTLLTGISFGVFSIIIIILKGSNRTHFSPTQLGWSFLTSLAAAAALILTAPKSLRSSKRLGMVLGSLLASFTLAHLDINLWRFLAYQSVLIGISFAFTNLDTHAALSTFSHSTIQHHHHTSTSHTTENAKMSKFSEFVLRNVPNNQLLHSILVEKDSRRIFYFMW
ncbi:putative zinc transporter msc2 [Lecanora helva]